MTGHDARDGVERGHHAQAPVVVETEIPITCIDIAPRYAEHRVTLPHQVADQRVVWRQIEYVVLHDPRRHDQYGFGEYRTGRRAVLDQFDQVIAEHDLAGRGREIHADLEALRACDGSTAGGAAGIVECIAGAPHEARAAGERRALEHLGIGERKIGRREHVEQLARGKRDHVLMVTRGAGHVVGRVAPPLLGQQKTLVPQAKRFELPRVGAKTFPPLARVARMNPPGCS